MICNVASPIGDGLLLRQNFHADIHAGEIVRSAQVAANYRHDLAVAAGDGDGDQVTAADAPVSRVESYPAGTREIDFRPGMGRARITGKGLRIEQISGDRTGTEAQTAHSINEQRGDVAAGAAPQCQCLARRLCPLLIAHAIGDRSEHPRVQILEQ